jgi:formamidopyrimidine-DNA glycosylase
MAQAVLADIAEGTPALTPVRAPPTLPPMPELPEVETVRRMLQAAVPGRRVARAVVSRHRLRNLSLARLPARLKGRTFGDVGRTGKFLLAALDGDDVLLSHLGMSGRWLFRPKGTSRDGALPHVHLRLEFTDGSQLWFQDVRRFGMLRVVRRDALARDASLRRLGPDPLEHPPTADSLGATARGARVAVKNFLLDQSRLAGLGNIYASEVLFRSRVDPRRRAGRLTRAEWARIAAEIPAVLQAAIARMGTTFSTYRTIWNEPGQYGEQLLVYDRAGEPCRRCGTTVRRIVQGGRSTFYCPACQRRGA